MIDLKTSERHISLTEAAQGRIPLSYLEQCIEDGILKVYWQDEEMYLDKRAIETLKAYWKNEEIILSERVIETLIADLDVN